MNPKHAAGLVLVVVVTAALLVHFTPRFWWAPDEGVYAYVADRIVQGAVLYRDVQDLHAGYVQLAHSAAFAFFGVDLLSLRYPLALVTVIQAALIFTLLSRRDLAAGVAGGLAGGGLTFIQFLNPSANWYALFVVVLLMVALHLHRRTSLRLLGIGFLLGALFLTRQLTGVLVGIGAVIYLLWEAHADRPARGRALLAPALLAVMAIGLTGYVLLKGAGMAILLYGMCPVLMVLWAFATLRPSDAATWRILGLLAAGGAIGAAPLFGYLLAHGALGAWFHDSFVVANRITQLHFIASNGYQDMLVLAAGTLVAPEDATAWMSAAFWVILLLLPLLVGALCVRRVTGYPVAPGPMNPVAFMAPFAGLVSIHYQIPIYLLFSSAALLWGLLALVQDRAVWLRMTASALTLVLTFVGVSLQAAQPLSRGFDGIVNGRTRPLNATMPLPRASLRMEAQDHALYSRLLELIDRHARDGAPIFALPVSPELYFLSGRNPPVPFFSTAIALADDSDVQAAHVALSRKRPAVIIHRTGDKYNSELGTALLNRLTGDYRLVEKVGDFDVWVYAGYPARSSVSVANEHQRASQER